MVKFELRNSYSSSPANSDHTFFMHPSGDKDEVVQLAVFNEHRFAFYYWIKWNLEKKESAIRPDLITFDWHQDLAFPEDVEKKELEKIDLSNLFESSFYAWARLNPLNDNHLLSAAYLNQLNDIWVVCKQSELDGWSDEEIVDLKGNVHKIRKFKNRDDLFNELKKTEIESVFFDIDLDFFTIENSTSNDRHEFTFVKDVEINSIFDIKSEFMNWIFMRLDGFTIALEPHHVGGTANSLKYLNKLEKIFFEGKLFHQDCKWKHLIQS